MLEKNSSSSIWKGHVDTTASILFTSNVSLYFTSWSETQQSENVLQNFSVFVIVFEMLSMLRKFRDYWSLLFHMTEMTCQMDGLLHLWVSEDCQCLLYCPAYASVVPRTTHYFLFNKFPLKSSMTVAGLRLYGCLGNTFIYVWVNTAVAPLFPTGVTGCDVQVSIADNPSLLNQCVKSLTISLYVALLPYNYKRIC